MGNGRNYFKAGEVMTENTDLECVSSALKSGEYDGTHIMQAWLAIDRLCKLEDFSLQEENAALREELAALRAAISVPWPINDAISKLSEAAAILLDDKSYDGQGHEEIRAALNAAKEYANKIEAE
tara:strand:- start:1400 stop:1774 length:375 start_codon:yes stop_codon:yes gene_type:complete